MHLHLNRARLPMSALFVGLSLALATAGASAQPTGNPAGTQSPDVRGQAAKTPATRAPQSGASANDDQRAPTGDGQARTNPDNPAARAGHTRTPGGGTAGGLTGRHPQGGSATDHQQHNRDSRKPQAQPAQRP